MKKRLYPLLALLCFSLAVPAAKEPTIHISGVTNEVTANIEARLKEFTKDKPLNTQSIEELSTQTAKAMQPYGYFKPQINILSREPLRISINPGPQVHINSVRIEIKGEGANNILIKRVLEPLPIKKGDPLNTIKYTQLKQKLLNAAEHQGFLRANFEKSEILVQPDSYTADITLILDTGSQFYFGQVRFDPTFISPDLLRRYIPFKYGQPYSTDQILMFNNQLASSGYFSNVSVKPQMDNSRYIPLDVHLQPAPRFNYSLGIGYGTDTGLRGRLGYHVVPLNPAGHKFNAIALGSFKENALQGQYIIPGTNPITDQYAITANLAHLSYDSGSSNSVLTSIAQQHTKPRFQRSLSLNGLYERYYYVTQPREEKNTLFPRATFTWTNAENKLFSPSGYNLTLNGLGASKTVLSEVNFAQASLNFRAALTLDAIRTRFYFHSIQGITAITDINQMPLSLAFLLGGADNLKAYSYNSLGPGKILTFNGLEIQKETTDHWYFVGFFDSGDVYMPISRDLKNDVGLGLMWVSPVGPIKVGVAQALNSHFNRSDKGPRLVINMGPDL
ncbi:outer membrane protein [Legionella lansingensis]|uniref:Translocation and assembly module subunit TamA n=1 Tax=Legionella lansingensis TaxID=45067 RepID=A0A0W0VY52_9GAMM|nr:POTRA domain-containing protein [Legionella lansingensis]KTD25020.1 outer membrane protein [Legionella lansingensis]SNV48632.1 outer membrane protein [Legionella lansingensis]